MQRCDRESKATKAQGFRIRNEKLSSKELKKVVDKRSDMRYTEKARQERARSKDREH